MIVSPELMSASSAPSARPLKTCETKLAQVNNVECRPTCTPTIRFREASDQV